MFVTLAEGNIPLETHPYAAKLRTSARPVHANELPLIFILDRTEYRVYQVQEREETRASRPRAEKNKLGALQ